MLRLISIAVITLALVHGFTTSDMVQGIKKLQNDRMSELAAI